MSRTSTQWTTRCMIRNCPHQEADSHRHMCAGHLERWQAEGAPEFDAMAGWLIRQRPLPADGTPLPPPAREPAAPRRPMPRALLCIVCKARTTSGGLCAADYMAWRVSGKPEHDTQEMTRFIAMRREWLQADFKSTRLYNAIRKAHGFGPSSTPPPRRASTPAPPAGAINPICHRERTRA